MKSSVQAVILCALVIGLAYLMADVMFNYAYDSSGSVIDMYQQAMLDDKSFFVEKGDQIQTVAAGLVDSRDVVIMRNASGEPRMIENGNAVPLKGSAAPIKDAVEEVFGENKAGITVYMVNATQNAVSYITNIYDSGFVGFLYEKVIGNTVGYETIELVENWKLFTKMK